MKFFFTCDEQTLLLLPTIAVFYRKSSLPNDAWERLQKQKHPKLKRTRTELHVSLKWLNMTGGVKWQK